MFDESKTIKEELLRIGLELGELVEVPYFSCGVQAGLPTDRGNTADGTIQVPRELMGGEVSYVVTVRGESMIDYDFREGDDLMVSQRCAADSGEIVIAMINGACTVKTYFEDEDGDKWLIPGNMDFSPILLSPDDDNRIIGVVKKIIHKAPRISYRDCATIIKSTKKNQKQEITHSDIARALKAAVEMMEQRGLTGSRPWFAVYRTFTDRSVVAKDDYSGFVALLNEIMGEEAPTISIRDMRANMDVQSFQDPVSLWTIDDAPIRNKFYAYLDVAKATNKALSR